MSTKKALTVEEVIVTVAVTHGRPGKSADDVIVEQVVDKAICAGSIEPDAAREVVKHISLPEGEYASELEHHLLKPSPKR